MAMFVKGHRPWNKENLSLDCSVCEKNFKVSPCHIKKGKKYCSISCRDIAYSKLPSNERPNFKGGDIKIKCLECEKEVKKRRKGNRIFKFCSIKCSRKNNTFKKGFIPWNKDRICPEMSGSNSGQWKGGITPINLAERVRFRQTIQKQVLERDNYTCQFCGEIGGVLHVDHIQSWAEYVELRFNIENCRTLCQECHFQVTYGKPMPPSARAWGHHLFKGVSEYV